MNKEKIIDYIYNEMDAEERQRFETDMKSDPALKREVKSLLGVRSFVADGLDFIPEPVPHFRPQSPRSYKWWAIAASLLLLISCGYFTGFRCSIQDNALVMGFGQSKDELSADYQPDLLTRKEFLAALEELRTDFQNDQPNSSETGISPGEAEKLINNALVKMDNKFQNYTREAYVTYQEDTRMRTEQLISEFLEYYEIKRAEDLNKINEGLTNLALMVQENSGLIPQYAYQPAQ